MHTREKFLKSVSYGAVLILSTLAAHASDRVFECKDAKGKTTYTNVPCEGQAIKPEALEASAYNTPYGEWLGQIQWKETTAGEGGKAHTVASMTLKIESGGRLTGTSMETGCRALGVAIPGAVATVLSLDVTLSSCQDAAFNQHYNGTLAIYPQQKIAQLYLLSPPIPLFGKSSTHDLSGTMRR
jgi:hypothetical protein